VGVSLLVAGDDVFALLICDEDLEYGARYFWCLLVGTLGKIFLGYLIVLVSVVLVLW
jgi:hypothetical protein